MTRRSLLLLGVLMLAAAGLVLQQARSSGSGYEIHVKRARIIRGNFDFIPEHWLEPKLLQLRNEENFSELSSLNQTDHFIKLCHWVHEQWDRSVPDPYPPANAIDILREIRSGRTGGFCGQYAYVLADVLKSMGYFCVRYVELWSRKRGSHFVVEAWNDEHEKWMILDADQDLFYSQEDGVPANALEVREALDSKRRVEARSCAPGHHSMGRRHMEYYAHFAVSLRSDLMRQTRPPTVADRFESFLFFRDQRTDLQTFNGRIPYRLVSRRVEDIYFDCNCVRVTHEPGASPEVLRFCFTTLGSVPNFLGFAIKMGEKASWTRIGGNEIVVEIDDLPLSFSVAAVNFADKRGCVNTVVIRSR